MQRGSLAGIFVGGASTRMGGSPKGLLRLSSGEAVVDRWIRVLGAGSVDCVLVGSRAEYAPRPMLADDVEDAGPLGGLVSLLRRVAAASDGASGPAWALALACDMPFVSAALVRRLVAAPYAVATAPRREGRWEPMFARYDAHRALAAVTERAQRGERSMQGLLDELRATELPLSSTEATELDDWDTVDDVQRRPA
jgi:molybdopterin-guanine dinucleotide biosynthesis protein A